MNVKYVKAENKVFKICEHYTMESIEGYGAHVAAILGTFKAQ